MNKELELLLQKAKEKVSSMSKEELEAMLNAQRESWARGMAPWPDAKPPKLIDGVIVYESYYDYCAD